MPLDVARNAGYPGAAGCRDTVLSHTPAPACNVSWRAQRTFGTFFSRESLRAVTPAATGIGCGGAEVGSWGGHSRAESPGHILTRSHAHRLRRPGKCQEVPGSANLPTGHEPLVPGSAGLSQPARPGRVTRSPARRRQLPVQGTSPEKISYTVRLMMSAGRAAGPSPGQGWSGARLGRGRAPNPCLESHAHFSGSR
jgi:hypothetical protein